MRIAYDEGRKMRAKMLLAISFLVVSMVFAATADEAAAQGPLRRSFGHCGCGECVPRCCKVFRRRDRHCDPCCGVHVEPTATTNCDDLASRAYQSCMAACPFATSDPARCQRACAAYQSCVKNACLSHMSTALCTIHY